MELLETTYCLHFSMLLFLPTATLKNLNTMFHNCFNSPVFANKILYFRYNNWGIYLNALSMSEKLVITLALERKKSRIDL